MRGEGEGEVRRLTLSLLPSTYAEACSSLQPLEKGEQPRAASERETTGLVLRAVGGDAHARLHRRQNRRRVRCHATRGQVHASTSRQRAPSHPPPR